MASTTLEPWRNPKLNVMGELFDYKIWNMQRQLGWPAKTGHFLSREDAEFKDSDYIHLDIGGEGYHKIGDIVSGFMSAINVNAQENDSQPPKANIPHLIKVQDWKIHPAYPFQDKFADYMTIQGARFTDKNVSEFARCSRPGGEIGLWIDHMYHNAIQRLADKLHSYVEWKAWDEFTSLGESSNEKKRIPVPGTDYMIGFSMGNNWFFIQRIKEGGILGPETDRGSWKFDYNALATFKICGQTYVYGWSSDMNYWFIQEVLPNGKLGNETQTGKFKFDYDIMTTTQIGGKTYLIGLSDGNNYLFIQELLAGGKLGNETFTETNINFNQVVPFTCDGQTYLFLFSSGSCKWEIRHVFENANGWELTDSGSWNNPYKHIVVNVQGKPILFGQNQSTHYWFLQPINEGGKMGRESDNGHWGYSYATLSTYTHGNKAYIFGQNSKGTRNWFIQEVSSNGKMGHETDHENWKFAYENVQFYTQYK